MKEDPSEDFLKVTWQCDKKNCKGENCRILEVGATIIDDQCDHCGKLIREPIWHREELDNNELYGNIKRDGQHE